MLGWNGKNIHLAVRPDDRPIVAHKTGPVGTPLELRIYSFTDSNCQTTRSTILDNTGDPGRQSSIAIRPVGLPNISSCRDNGGSAMACNCGDPDCLSALT